MRISDWSSDVCSSDLGCRASRRQSIGASVGRACRPPGTIADEVAEAAVAGEVALEGEAEAFGGRRGAGVERRILGLRQVDKLLIVAEVERTQLRMAVDAETLDDQALGREHGEAAGRERGW